MGRVVDRRWVRDRRWQDRKRDMRERLGRAFRALRGEGFVARQRFRCCSSCACADLEEVLRERGGLGAVYYHAQDAEVFKDRDAVWKRAPGLFVRFGALPDAPWSDAEVGAAAVAALRDVGLEPDWDGDPDVAVWVPFPRVLEVAS